MEELEVEEVYQGRDIATLEVVKEATRPLAHSQLAGFEVPAGHAV